MHVQMENRRPQQHHDLRIKMQAFIDNYVDDMLENNKSVTVARAVQLSCHAKSTVYAWLDELKAHKLIEVDAGLIIVRGVVFEDLR